MRFILPIAVTLPRKTKPGKRVILNLNEYRNWPYFLSNDIKKQYREDLRAQLEGVKIPTPCTLHFTLFRKDARIGDRANVLAVQEKFFCDAATFYRCWEDDNDTVVLSSHYYTGPIDRTNPRVEVEIK